MQGWDKLPDDIKEYTDSCVRVNVGFTHMRWDDAMIRALLTTHGDAELIKVYESLDSWAAKSDLARYLILWHYGGFYFDTDFMFFKPVDVFIHTDFMRTKSRYLSKFRYSRVLNAMIGAKSHHPIFKIALDLIKDRIQRPRAVLDLYCKTAYRTGCNLFSDAITQYHCENPADSNYLIIANEQLFPSSMTDNNHDNLKRFKHTAFMHHHHKLSWNTSLRFYMCMYRYKYVGAAALLLVIIAIIIYFRYIHK